MKVLCKICNLQTNHTLITEHVVSDDDMETKWQEESKYQIVVCAGCDNPSFRLLYTDSSLMYTSPTIEDSYEETLYPDRSISFIKPKQFKNATSNVKKIYDETILAYNNKQYILCSGGVRAIIEGICVDKKVTSGLVEVIKDDGTKTTKKSKSLEGKIEGLCEAGYLAKKNAKALHELRFIGNDALHALGTPTNKELNLAIEIVDNIIENIYEIEVKAKNLSKNPVKLKQPAS